MKTTDQLPEAQAELDQYECATVPLEHAVFACPNCGATGTLDNTDVCSRCGFYCPASTDEEEEPQDDLLVRRLAKSVQQSCKHPKKQCVSTSESGSNTCYVHWICGDCKKDWMDELLPAEYDALIAECEGEA